MNEINKHTNEETITLENKGEDNQISKRNESIKPTRRIRSKIRKVKTKHQQYKRTATLMKAKKEDKKEK